MKKFLIVAGVVVVLAVLGIGYAFAQSPTPGDPTAPAGPGQRGWGGMGMMGQAYNGDYGPLHTYMFDAMADAFGLTPEDLQARHDAGDTMWTIAQELGITEERFLELMTQARTTALENAVADGVITQEQADWMLQRMTQMHANGFGPGSGGCMGGGRAGMQGPGRGGGRMPWNGQPVRPTY